MDNNKMPLVASLVGIGTVGILLKWWYNRKSPPEKVKICMLFWRGYFTPHTGVEPFIMDTFLLINGIERDFNYHLEYSKIESCEISYKGREATNMMDCFIMLKELFNVSLFEDTAIVSESWITDTLFNKLIPATKFWRWSLDECPNWPEFMPLALYNLDDIYETSYAIRRKLRRYYFLFTTKEDQAIPTIFDCIQKISVALGDNAYFNGPNPGFVDSIVFGTLAILYFTPGAPFRSIIESYENLEKYLKTMKENVWPKWTDYCIHQPDEEVAPTLQKVLLTKVEHHQRKAIQKVIQDKRPVLS